MASDLPFFEVSLSSQAACCRKSSSIWFCDPGFDPAVMGYHDLWNLRESQPRSSQLSREKE